MREKDIENEIAYLEEILKKVGAEADKIKKYVPKGARLRAFRHGKDYQYYMRRCGVRDNGEYIKRKDIKLVSMLAQLEYDEKLSGILQQLAETLRTVDEAGVGDAFEEALEQMIPGKRELVKPHYVSDEMYIRNWKEQE